MNVLFLSNLFPNSREPTRGIFNAQQIAALAKQCSVVKIIAPLPTSLPTGMFGNVPVAHPQFRHIPILSRPFNGWLFARAIEKEIRNSEFDIALVNWAYPDAYGVMLLAQKFGFPFATTVQGSDVNVLFQNPACKRQILRALRASCAVFTRSNALRDRLAQEGLQPVTVYNGIDREKFQPIDRDHACRQLGLPADRRRILYVGNLQPIKGPTILASAFALLKNEKNVDLIYLGSGPEHDKIAKILGVQSPVSSLPGTASRGLGSPSSVFFAGPRPHSEIPLWMGASDVLCLPSLNEGLPNVALEALACGLPVVASHVGGVPEIVQDGVNGLLVPPGNVAALATALRTALARTWDRSILLGSVKRFDWDENARQVRTVLQSAIQSHS